MEKLKTKPAKIPLRCTLLFFLTMLLILSSSTGCLFQDDPASQPGNAVSPQPVVYTSIYPLYDFTKKIGGEKITVINITPVGTEPHSFEPSSKLLADLSKAELFIYNGAGMEPYLEKFLATLQGTPLLMIEAGHGISLIDHAENNVENNAENNHNHEHGSQTTTTTCIHGTTDPHIWLSPSCALYMGQNILHALIQIDPDNKAYYENNYQEFKEQLSELDRQYKETLAQCQRKEIVVTHEAFGYLCQDYGLIQVPIMGLNSESEPTPGKMKEIIQYVKKKDIDYIFFETFYSPKVSETISQETGAKVLQLNTLGSLTEEEISAGKDYFSMMRENLANLKQALDFQP